MAEKGEGIALGWSRSVEGKLSEGKLVRIPGMSMALPESIFTYRRKFATTSPVAEEFVALLKQNIEPVS